MWRSQIPDWVIELIKYALRRRFKERNGFVWEHKSLQSVCKISTAKERLDRSRWTNSSLGQLCSNQNVVTLQNQHQIELQGLRSIYALVPLNLKTSLHHTDLSSCFKMQNGTNHFHTTAAGKAYGPHGSNSDLVLSERNHLEHENRCFKSCNDISERALRSSDESTFRWILTRMWT